MCFKHVLYQLSYPTAGLSLSDFEGSSNAGLFSQQLDHRSVTGPHTYLNYSTNGYRIGQESYFLSLK